MNRRSHNSSKRTRRVEAWIYTVINPLIEALKVEKSLLEQRNWTWRYHSRALEYIHPLDKYIDVGAQPNFEDFFKANPQMERERLRHEKLRADLAEFCRRTHDFLVTSKEFLSTKKQVLKTYKTEAGEYPGGAVPQEDFEKLIAQYVVNSTRELPDYYTTSKFWNKFADEFDKLRSSLSFKELEARGKKLEKHSDLLMKKFIDLRAYLCEKYDLPPAPIPEYVSAR